MVPQSSAVHMKWYRSPLLFIRNGTAVLCYWCHLNTLIVALLGHNRFLNTIYNSPIILCTTLYSVKWECHLKGHINIDNFTWCPTKRGEYVTIVGIYVYTFTPKINLKIGTFQLTQNKSVPFLAEEFVPHLPRPMNCYVVTSWEFRN
jgi:hypothetical protein